jgi:hypothetical protein
MTACSDVNNSGKVDDKKDLDAIERDIVVADWVLGTWKFNDDNDKETSVVLYPDGSAIGTNGDIGSWYYDGEIHLIWTNGWMNLIKKGWSGGYEKTGYAPGDSTDGISTNKSKAIKLP